MATRQQIDLETPTCSVCEQEMDLVAQGTEKPLPILGGDVEYVRYSCPTCGQGIRFEREDPSDEWRQPGIPDHAV